jgi:hypothetical protein
MKTPQEAAREYAHDHIAERCKSTNCKEFDCRPFDRNVAGYHTRCRARYQECRDGFLAGVAWADQWISVEDELPEPGEPYDEKYYSVKCPLFSESGYAFAEFGRDSCWVEDSTGRDITQYVTHWRPIEPVKE